MLTNGLAPAFRRAFGWRVTPFSRTLFIQAFLPASLGLLLLHATPLFGSNTAGLAAQLCAPCHGDEFRGGRVPAIRGGQWRRAQTDAEALQIITHGLPGTEMVGFGQTLSSADRVALLNYIRSPDTKEVHPAVVAPAVQLEKEVRTELHDFTVEQVARGFEIPWSLAFLPDGRMIVTERAGHVRIVEQGRLSPPIRGVPRVRYVQDGGMLALTLDPDYAQSGWIYLSYADPGRAPGTSMTKIVRGRVTDGAWVDQQVVWQADPRYYRTGDDHYGCRLLFHEGKLYFSIGDRGGPRNAQDLANPSGKIHRVNADGSIPSDNPFLGDPAACPSIWSWGHRNPQGLAIDPQTGELWSTEHGPMGGDELNRIQRGKNYGWPVVTFGREHSGAMISELTSKPGLEDPVTQWTPSIAACPILFSNSDRYPKWKQQLLVGSLSFQELRRVEFEAGQVVRQEVLFKGRGRIRDIKTGPDGYLYLVMEQRGLNGEIIRLVPRS